jgi:transposase
MDHFAGLDVSVKETSICIVDDTGRIVREAKVASEPEAVLQVLRNPIYRFKRIGLEAGPLSQWLFIALAERSCAEHAALEEMVLAQGLGHADRQAPRDEKAIVALARRLAVILHRIWVDGTEFRWTRETVGA